MPSKDPSLYLHDMADAMDQIESFLKRMDITSQAQFVADPLVYHACVRMLEVVSEASRRVPEEIKERHPHIPWTDVAAAGNVYRHDYPGVDPAIVWRTVAAGLGPLREVVAEELERFARRGK